MMEMKKRSQKAWRVGHTLLRSTLSALMAFILCVTMLTGMAPKAAAAGDSSLTIRIPEKDRNGELIDPGKLSEVQIVLYKIGEKTGTGWTLNSTFNVDGWQEKLTGDPNAEMIMEAVDAFEKIIEEKPVSPTAGPQNLTVSGGVASTTFSNIESGYYLVKKYVPDDPNAEGEGSKALLMYPFLATLETSVTVDAKVYIQDVPKTKVIVHKTWTDEGAKLHHKDVEITVHLYADDVESKKPVTLTADNDWTAEWDDLYVYKSVIKGEGKEAQYQDEAIKYSVQEDRTGSWVEFYDTPIYSPEQAYGAVGDTVQASLTFDIENPHKKGSLKIEKNVTVNGSATKGKAADGTYKFNIEGVDVEYKSEKPIEITIKNGKSKTATVDNLPCGTYKITEVAPTNGTHLVADDQKEIVVSSDSTTEIETKSFTNNIDVTTVKVTKKWSGGKASDRPASITVKLYADGKLKDSQLLNSKNSWSYTWADLPKYQADGKTAIKYALDEVEVKGFTSSGPTTTTGPADQNYAIVNTFVTPTPTPTVTTRPPSNRTTPPPTETTPPPDTTPTPTPPPTTQVNGQKIWRDDNDVHGLRPDAITVELLADGVVVSSTPIWRSQSGNTWSFSFLNLPAVNDEGATINYTVRELPVEGYTTTVDGNTIINELIPRTPSTYINIAGVKIWDDSNNAMGTRPNYIIIHLLRDGVEIGEQRTVTAANEWQFSFQNLPQDDGYGHTYTYAIREDTVPGYFTRINGYNITNIRLPETIEEKTPLGTQNEEGLEELLDLFDYGTPLFGELLQTGDETPMYPYIFGGIGALAILILLVAGRRRRREEE